MKIHDVIHGFAIRAVHELSEIRGKLWEMEHVKSGAKLVWLDRKDENKTFSITFRTLPSDDTPTRDGTTMLPHIDSKRRKKLKQKKTALGHAEDDHEDWDMKQEL